MSADTAGEAGGDWVPVTFDGYDHVRGPFYHGTSVRFVAGDELVPGHRSNYQAGRVSNNVYFSALVELDDWDGHAPEVLQTMLDNLATLRARGLDLIED